MGVITLTSSNFDEVIASSKQPVLVDFWATWCGPCKMVSPIVDEIADEEDVTVGKVNVDDEPELAQRFGVMSIPTLLVFVDGKQVNKSVGAIPKDDILDLLGL
jgi:thioredoxin 1